jgi:hypothetical protein
VLLNKLSRSRKSGKVPHKEVRPPRVAAAIDYVQELTVDLTVRACFVHYTV